MQTRKLGQIVKGQDGAVLNGYLFRFNASGVCRVYRVEDLSQPVAEFTLDKSDMLMPHSNSVMFSKKYYAPSDEFPLLYSNIYNSYAKEPDRRKGMTCVYRIERAGNTFTSTLVQVIAIGFADDALWQSDTCDDVRPYGNFALTENRYYAFTMRDASQTTRYFAFPLPSVHDGVYDSKLGAKCVCLQKEAILEQFDCPYQHYLQGATCHNGVIYSLEGFTDGVGGAPALRLVNLAERKQEKLYYFSDCGLTVEPELIDFDGGICYYADHDGNVYELTFAESEN